MKTAVYAALAPSAALAPWGIERRAVMDDDVLIDIDYCGICRSDVDQSSNQGGPGLFPMVPGQEIVGRVTQAGKNVRDFRAGDLVGVGGIVDSCRQCDPCAEHLEQFCAMGMSSTYNDYEQDKETPTYGGYSERIVVHRHYVFRIPPGLKPAAAAPLLCAGVTAWSHLRHGKVGADSRVGIAGIGGIGHLGIKLAHAFGAEVIAITTSPVKAADAKRIGADRAILATSAEELRWNAGSFDFILDTVPARHDVNPYLSLLKPDGILTMAAVADAPPGALVGGLQETQDVLDYCGTHKIAADVEIIPVQKINEAYARIARGDVRYRFVIDMHTLAR
jgi:uncharacterized zinc-type alcohol dehydrogenase-like protein